MIELKNTGVEFIDDSHQYFLNGKELSGITGVLKDKLFPDMYKGVPKNTLQNAANRGSVVHEQIEIVDTLGVEPSLPEVKAYLDMKKELGYETVKNEYIVTDFDSYASGIDLVMHKIGTDNEVELWDIKHTYNVHKAYVEWQLSIYKAWFEAINPDLKVTAVKCLWLRDDRTRGLIHKLIPLNPHSADEVKHLFECIRENKPYGNDEGKPEYLSYIEENEARVVFLTKTIGDMTDELNEIKDNITKMLQDAGKTKCDTDRIGVSLKSGSTSTSFDTKTFKEKEPDLYDKLFKEFSKTTERKGSLTLKVKDDL